MISKRKLHIGIMKLIGEFLDKKGDEERLELRHLQTYLN